VDNAGNESSKSSDVTATPDGTAPTISSVTSTTSDGTYGIGDEINVTVNFSEAVTLSGGNLVVTLETGDTDQTVTISSISSATSASGTYTVQSGDASSDLSVSTIALSAGTLSDAASNNMSSFSIPSGSNLADSEAFVVDGTAPTMTIATTMAITPVVTTLAGSGSSGSANGTGTAATFNNPYGVAVDGSGNVYVADYANNLIRKITAAGVVTTLAGSGSQGSADGEGTAASFYNPRGVAVDGSGNVYVADYEYHLIRKITSAGVVTTLAGSGSWGSANGSGTAASFNGPNGVAVDGSGNVYVADYFNHLIRKITSAGVVTTLAGSGSSGYGNGTGTAASFNSPVDVAVDGSGNVYVADLYNHLIRKITAAGVVTTLAGSGSSGSANGTGTAASFAFPHDVAVDGSGNVYVADYFNHLIRKITSAGVVTTLAGSGSLGSADGIGTAASFNYPWGVAVDGSGNVYVGDYGNHLIRKIVTTLASGSTTNDATLPLIFTSSEPIYRFFCRRYNRFRWCFE
jgi:hypothetical protein